MATSSYHTPNGGLSGNAGRMASFQALGLLQLSISTSRMLGRRVWGLGIVIWDFGWIGDCSLIGFSESLNVLGFKVGLTSWNLGFRVWGFAVLHFVGWGSYELRGVWH